MRFFASVRLPIFKAFAPRVGFVTGSFGHRHYTSSMVDETTLLPEHHHPLLGFIGYVALGTIIAGLLYLAATGQL
jgi:hypothetical protein